MTTTQPALHVDIEWATGRNAESLLADLAKAGLTIVRQAEVERLRVREQHAIEYERRISWDTTCGSCADHLDASIKEYERAWAAEAALARVRGIVGDLSDAVDAQCDLGGGICQAHGVDLWEGRCSLAFDLERIRAVIRGESR